MTKRKKGDATPRVSEKPSAAQSGPSPKDVVSRKRSTDTRGSKNQDEGLTAAQVAERQPIRRSDLPSPAERQKVKGQRVDVVATPMRVDPIELKPSKRDTLIKDTLRTEGKNEHADAPTRSVEGGQWHDQNVKVV